MDAYDGSVTLLWEPGHSGGRGGPAATSFDVYWGTSQNLAADADLGTPIRTTTLTVDIQPLAFDTTYYWRVDANNAAGATRGDVWSFTTSTAPAPPTPAPPPRPRNRRPPLLERLGSRLPATGRPTWTSARTVR